MVAASMRMMCLQEVKGSSEVLECFMQNHSMMQASGNFH